MGHRHLMNSSLQMFEMNQEHYGSHGTAEQSHIHMGMGIQIFLYANAFYVLLSIKYLFDSVDYKLLVYDGKSCIS